MHSIDHLILREGWGTNCPPNWEKQIIIVIAKNFFPIFERYCKSGVIISSNEIPKNFIWMLGLVLYFLAIKPLTTTPFHKTESIFPKKKKTVDKYGIDFYLSQIYSVF